MIVTTAVPTRGAGQVRLNTTGELAAIERADGTLRLEPSADDVEERLVMAWITERVPKQ
jgi:hypothetical protein